MTLIPEGGTLNHTQQLRLPVVQAALHRCNQRGNYT